VFCETQAHARFLSAAALHPRRDIVATVAEDGTIAVWGMPGEITDTNDDDDKNEIAETSLPKSLFASRWPDGMLTGVAFCGDGDDALAVCAYDETEIVAWQ
jgi:WD40 repeat protein